jgi:hypothetical protein
MKWEVEYTDEFEQWWQALTEAEQGIFLHRCIYSKKEVRVLGFRTVAVLADLSIVICESLELSIMAGHSELYMLSTLDETPFY